MVVVRRLLGLSADAGSEDIRAFFNGLHIPEGYVHIIGGRRGEAFVIFNTERDGDLALERSGELLRGSSVTVNTSSLTEMKRKIESRLRKPKGKGMEKRVCLEKARAVMEVEKKAEPEAVADLGTALLLGLVAAIQGLHSNSEEKHGQLLPAIPPSALPNQSENQPGMCMDKTHPIYKVQENDTQLMLHDHSEHERRAPMKSHERGYLRLYGLPNPSKKTVCRFLEGLSVLEVIPSVNLGRDQCCLVKVASLEEAEEGLKYSHSNLGCCCVEVRTANERMWTYAMELYKRNQCSKLDRVSPDGRFSRTLPAKRLSEVRSLSGSPKRRNFDTQPTGIEYCVMINNLSPRSTKTEIKELFSCPHVPSNNIIHLLNKQRERTSTAFIILTNPEDYAAAMNMDGRPNGSKVLDVSSITKEKMRDLMYNKRCKETERSGYGEQDCVDPAYIYARNFPGDVTKREVKDFFCLYHISEDDVILLKDDHGNGIGEAIVQFWCEPTARKARSLHGGFFLGHKIILNCITPEQMKTILQETY